MSKGLDKITSEIVRKIVLRMDGSEFQFCLHELDVNEFRNFKNDLKQIIKDEIKEIYADHIHLWNITNNGQGS